MISTLRHFLQFLNFSENFSSKLTLISIFPEVISQNSKIPYILVEYIVCMKVMVVFQYKNRMVFLSKVVFVKAFEAELQRREN